MEWSFSVVKRDIVVNVIVIKMETQYNDSNSMGKYIRFMIMCILLNQMQCFTNRKRIEEQVLKNKRNRCYMFVANEGIWRVR